MNFESKNDEKTIKKTMNFYIRFRYYFLMPFSSLLGAAFPAVFQDPENPENSSQRVPDSTSFSRHLCTLLQKGRKSIFEHPYMENTAFSAPGAP